VVVLLNKAAMSPLLETVQSTTKLSFACRQDTLVLATETWVLSGHQTGSYSNSSIAFDGLLKILSWADFSASPDAQVCFS